MAARKTDYMEFIKWLKDSINSLDKKIDSGLNNINNQLKQLNGSVNQNSVAIAQLLEWKKEHEEQHKKTTKLNRFIIKTLFGSGILLVIIMFFLNKL